MTGINGTFTTGDISNGECIKINKSKRKQFTQWNNECTIIGRR
jgi:hypothetical protein